jgi:thioredoxin-related protein
MSLDTDKIKKSKATGPVRYNLKPGQALYDSEGNLIAEMPGAISEKELAMLKKAQEKKEKKSGPDLTKRAKGGMINKYAKGGSVKKNKMLTTKGWGASRKT